MTNIEKLKELGILGMVRKRLGADDENDEAHDERINAMSNTELIEQWCGWTLGSGTWWTEMKDMFDTLEEMDGWL